MFLILFLGALFFYFITKESTPKHDPTLQAKVNAILEKLDREEEEARLKNKYYYINGRLYSEAEKEASRLQIENAIKQLSEIKKDINERFEEAIKKTLQKAAQDHDNGLINDYEYNRIINECLEYKDSLTKR